MQPGLVQGFSRIMLVAAGGRHTLAIRNDGTVWASGHNQSGQIGDGNRLIMDLRSPTVQTVGLNGIGWFNVFDSTALASFAVTLDPNGGSVTPTSVTVVTGGTYSALPTPTRKNYTFDGWYTVASGGVKINLTDIVGITSDTTFYAHWTAVGTPTTYALTVNGGSGSGNFAVGATVTTTGNAAPTGQRFKQWNISLTVTFTGGTSNTSSAAQFAMPSQAVTATAVYENLPADQYSINVQTDGNGTASASATSVAQGTEITLTASENSGADRKLFFLANSPCMRYNSPGQPLMWYLLFEHGRTANAAQYLSFGP